MLKVRLMGTKNDIAWFQKILQRHPKIEVMELSELYSNKPSIMKKLMHFKDAVSKGKNRERAREQQKDRGQSL